MHQYIRNQESCSLWKFVMGEVVVVLMSSVGLAGLAQAMQPSEHQFVVLHPDKSNAVWLLDTNTSLRWQQTPGAPGDNFSLCDNGDICTWQEAVHYCAALGGGSRLAEVEELISLLDYSDPLGSANALNAPNGPFTGVLSRNYWSASTNADRPTFVWFVFFGSGNVITFNKASGTFNNAWCVRGGQAYDGQDVLNVALAP